MSTRRDWPSLQWEPPSERAAEWLLDRTIEIAARARAFEVGLEQAGEAEEIDLGLIASELEAWDKRAAQVFAYTAMGEGRPLPADCSAFVRQLEETYGHLTRIRARLLSGLGAQGAAVVSQREEAAEIDRARLRQRPDEAPALELITGEQGLEEVDAPVENPVRAEELRMRSEAEQKPLPEEAHLADLLATLPSDWLRAVFENLGLAIPEAPPASASRSSVRRQAVAKHLLDEENLGQVTESLDPMERGLVSELLSAGGSLPYKQITETYGLDEADGFYWSERPPSGPLASLRRLGLVFVGTRNGQLTTTVATELRDGLRRLLAPD
ncbi:MAG TPA: hypothetical protein DFS52_31805 [Myxococcales bacterium]|jgi:hypothetical protein|nr:hypothetical protein [Myxococcales bacterium]